MKYLMALCLAAWAAGAALADTNFSRLRVYLPADAELWVDDYKSTKASDERVIKLKDLNPEKSYSYTVTAKVYRNGQYLTQRRTVSVRAGYEYTVRFDFADVVTETRGYTPSTGSTYVPATGSTYAPSTGSTSAPPGFNPAGTNGVTGLTGGFGGMSRPYTGGSGGSTGSGPMAIKINPDGSRTLVPVGGAGGSGGAFRPSTGGFGGPARPGSMGSFRPSGGGFRP